MPGSAWADEKLAELAEQLSKMVEHPTSKSTQPNYLSRCTTLQFYDNLHISEGQVMDMGENHPRVSQNDHKFLSKGAMIGNRLMDKSNDSVPLLCDLAPCRREGLGAGRGRGGGRRRRRGRRR